MSNIWSRSYVRHTFALLLVIGLVLLVTACDDDGDDDDVDFDRVTLVDRVQDAFDDLDDDEDGGDLEDLLVREGVRLSYAEDIGEEYDKALEDAEDAEISTDDLLDEIDDMLDDLDDDADLGDITDAIEEAIENLEDEAADAPKATATPKSRVTPVSESSKAQEIKDEILADLREEIDAAKSGNRAELEKIWKEIDGLNAAKVMTQKDEFIARIEAAVKGSSDKDKDPKVTGNADVRKKVGSATEGAWNVTYYEGVTDQMRGWFADILDPNPDACPAFPNVDDACVISGFKFQAAHGLEYGLDERNYCDNDICDVLVQARGYNLITADYDFGFISCKAGDEGKGCGIMLINVGEVTTNLEDVHVDNGFSVAGRYWDGDFLHEAIWAAVSHASANMLNYDTTGAGDDTLNDPDRTNAGANCSIPDGCQEVRFPVIILSGNQVLGVAETIVK